MTTIKRVLFAGCAMALAFGAAAASRADTLDVTLTDPSQTVPQGTTLVTFDATISNPSPTDTIYLNADMSSTDSLLVTVDDSPFFLNAPIDLTPGESSGPFALFNVDLPSDITPGTYTGTFSILGGADGGTGTLFDDLADANFSVDVKPQTAASTPEPGTFLLTAIALMVAGLLGRKRAAACSATTNGTRRQS
jgi:hypothetical protein